MPLKRKVFRVLELGAGQAPVLRSVRLRHPKKRIELTAVDRKIKIDAKNLLKQIKLKMHSSEVADFLRDISKAPSNYFHEIHLHMLDKNPNLLDHLTAIFRVLKPGGRVFVIEQADESSYPRHFLDEQLGREVHEKGIFYSRKAINWLRNAGGKKRELIALRNWIAKKNAEFIEIIRKAGFEIERITVHDLDYYKRDKRAEIPLGVVPNFGDTLSNKNASNLISNLTDETQVDGTQFIILRKPIKKVK